MSKQRNPASDLDDRLQRGFRYALALTHHAAQAEDLVQEACLALLKRNQAIAPPLLFTVIRNRFIDHYRRAKRFPVDSLSSDPNVIPLQLTAATIRDEARLADSDMLAQSLGKLSVEEREAFFLWAAEGYTAKEIADLGRLSRNTVLSRIHRARRKLRVLLNGAGTEVA